MEKLKITISGDLGSGKSTVSRLLAERLQLQRYSTGDIQRRLAAERGMTSLEFNQLAEQDRSIDTLIDNGTIEIANSVDRLVFDSRLAWHFVPDSIKIYLSVDPRVAAQRVAAAGRGSVESYQSVEEAMALMNARRQSEIERFIEYYGVNIDSYRNFDLVVDTTYATPEEVADMICQLIADGLLATKPTLVVHPSLLLPLPESSDKALSIRADGSLYWLGDGARLSADRFLVVELAFENDEQTHTGETAREFVRRLK